MQGLGCESAMGKVATQSLLQNLEQSFSIFSLGRNSECLLRPQLFKHHRVSQILASLLHSAYFAPE